MFLLSQVKEVEAAAERAAVQSAAIIEEAMAQAEELRRKATQESHSQVACFSNDRLIKNQIWRGQAETHVLTLLDYTTARLVITETSSVKGHRCVFEAFSER